MRIENASPSPVFLKDYVPYPFIVKNVEIQFDLQPGATTVKSRLTLERKEPSAQDLFLNGEDIELLSVSLNGKKLEKDAFDLTSKGLTIGASKIPGDAFELIIVTRIDPSQNTRLEGLYMSGGNYCTQCEAEGFRRITFYPDRPDVLSVFTVRVEADLELYPILLSNGNCIETGRVDDGRHYAIWHDPFPKPCYLFALVAGKLCAVEDHFLTHSGRKVDLKIYVRPGDEGQCLHAMESLKKSMKWDEDVYGLEYDLDVFNIVAVSDFNMGAMENKSLNIFNTALVLAHPDTATDSDFMRVESVIAHEYFHNWSGNRVTCRDWFQLSLKEGLTVFRDQEFSSDMHSPAVQRIDDVMHLRRFQFAEDAGPLAHPVRPDQYIEINNFYTMTVYEKGAELIRMLRLLMGAEIYRRGTDLYFSKYDGQAVTCDDFVRCMEEVSGIDLAQFRLWYTQAGTPQVKFKGAYDPHKMTYTIDMAQTIPDTPGQADKMPMHIPVVIALLDRNGEQIDIPESARLLNLREAAQRFVIENIKAPPVPSVLRGFSAPVRLDGDLSDEDLAVLMRHDSDGFNRFDAAQAFMLRQLGAMIDQSQPVSELFLNTYEALLAAALRTDSDKALMARMIGIPDISIIAQERKVVDPQAIFAARENVLNAVARRFESQLSEICEANKPLPLFTTDPTAMGRRVLHNTAFLIRANRLGDLDAENCARFYESATNMTDRMATLHLACALDASPGPEIVTDFYKRYESYPLVIDKWFGAQAMIAKDKTLEIVGKLKKHSAFSLKNPNRARSLYGAFAMNNPVQFHRPDGAGYEFLTRAVIELNAINPQIAARLLTPLRDWRRYTPNLQTMMKLSLERVLAAPNLSPDVFEIASKSLNA